ncbi:P-loop NTPase fold protein [Streptomyces platensis]|uniref:P-loop NTPase fold protein n=1 Tax=Streptomyces platensis TaxID=58346 RepID=UPI003C2D6812
MPASAPLPPAASAAPASPAPAVPAPRVPFALLNDEPVAGPGADLLGAGRAARRLAGLLVASRASTPFTLAVDAGWGMGKSCSGRAACWSSSSTTSTAAPRRPCSPSVRR